MVPYEEDRTAREAHLRRARHWALRRDAGLSLVCWAALLGAALWLISHVLRATLLLVVAALLAYALAPLVARLRRWMPQWLAIVAVYLGLLAVLGLFGYLIVSATVQQLTALAEQAQDWLTPGAHGEPSPLVAQLHNFGISQQQLDDAIRSLAGQAQTLSQDVIPLLTGFANGALDAVLILVVSVYLLIDGARVSRWLRTGTPRRYRPRVNSILDTFQRVVGGYIRGQVTLAALIGVLVGAGMGLIPFFRLPFAILLGVLAFIFAFIPILGTFLSGAVCVLVALSQGGWVTALFVLAYFVGVHVVEGDVVGPRIVGKAVGLHPVVSILALVAGAEVFGILGALFAAPVAGVIQALIADFWIEWKKSHAEEFGPEPAGAIVQTVAPVAAEGISDTAWLADHSLPATLAQEAARERPSRRRTAPTVSSTPRRPRTP
jgi:predicted PurR-regulated permease PerM